LLKRFSNLAKHALANIILAQQQLKEKTYKRKVINISRPIHLFIIIASFVKLSLRWAK